MTAPFRRRTLMKAAGTALSALPLRGFAVTETRPVHFTHHVASGDPLADRVMLWTRGCCRATARCVLCGAGGKLRPLPSSQP